MFLRPFISSTKNPRPGKSRPEKLNEPSAARVFITSKTELAVVAVKVIEPESWFWVEFSVGKDSMNHCCVKNAPPPSATTTIASAIYFFIRKISAQAETSDAPFDRRTVFLLGMLPLFDDRTPQ